MRAPVVAGALALTLLGGCDVGSTTTCTLMGGDSGITVIVDKGYASKVVSGTLRLCRGSNVVCEEHPFNLSGAITLPESRPGLMQNGAKFQRVLLPDLPDRQVTVWLILRSKSGKVVVDANRDVTPGVSYPNGPECKPRMVSALVHVDSTGAVTVSSGTGA